MLFARRLGLGARLRNGCRASPSALRQPPPFSPSPFVLASCATSSISGPPQSQPPQPPQPPSSPDRILQSSPSPLSASRQACTSSSARVQWHRSALRTETVNIFTSLTGETEPEGKSEGERPSGVGQVTNRRQGVVTVTGLEGIQLGEILWFNSGAEALVMEIRKEYIRAAILCDEDTVEVDDEAFRANRSLSIPVGSEILSRTIDPLGRPLDGLGAIKDAEMKELSLIQPRVFVHTTVPKFISTGIKAMDVFRPIVHGGRFGIFGKNPSATTDVAISMIEGMVGINEGLDSLPFFVYVTLGKSQHRQDEIVAKLDKAGALERSVIIHASETSGVVQQYFAPLVGCLISDFFRDNGMHALVVIDDLSKHHAAYENLTEQMQMTKPAIVQTYAEIMNHFYEVSEQAGSGSATALALVSASPNDIIETHVEELITFLDSNVFIDEKLSKLFPGISLNSLVKSTPSPYQLPMVRGFYIRILSTLRKTQGLVDRAEMARDLGIDLLEESDIDIEREIEFPQKFEALLNQTNSSSLQATLISLYFASESLLFGWELHEMGRFDQAVHEYLKKERPELLSSWPLDREVPDFVFADLDGLVRKFAVGKVSGHISV